MCIAELLDTSDFEPRVTIDLHDIALTLKALTTINVTTWMWMTVDTKVLGLS